MKQSMRKALLGLLGTSFGLYMLAVPLIATAHPYTPFGYHNYQAMNPIFNNNSQYPIGVVKTAAAKLGFNVNRDTFTLKSQSSTSAIVTVLHNGANYDVTLQQLKGQGAWVITSVRNSKIRDNSAKNNTNSTPATGTTNSGSLAGSGTTTTTTAPTISSPSTNNVPSATVATPASSGNAAAAEQQAVDLLNADRRANGLAGLQVDSRLTTLAQNYAQDMINRNYFSHYNPEGQSPFDRMTQAGITYSAAGENIAINQSVPKAEVAFMNSSGHRANILNSTYTKVGIGVAFDKNGNVYVVQDFIRP